MEKLEPTGKSETCEGSSDNFLAKQFSKFTEINKKYAKPQIKMTPMVRIALLGLRIYLIVLVLVLVYKFFTLIRV
ncbi:MAG: hypothetical protein NTV68_12525 [Methanomicrobiales archaeon]|nr:hypothetical protein [Methanomicrobiales archaeon]